MNESLQANTGQNIRCAKCAAVFPRKEHKACPVCGSIDFIDFIVSVTQEDSVAVQSLIDQLVSAIDSKDKAEIISWLARHHAAEFSPENLSAIGGFLADDAPDVRARAAKLLGRCKATAFADPLRKLLSDSADDVARTAALALRMMGDASVGPELEQTLADLYGEDDKEERRTRLVTLRKTLGNDRGSRRSHDSNRQHQQIPWSEAAPVVGSIAAFLSVETFKDITTIRCAGCGTAFSPNAILELLISDATGHSIFLGSGPDRAAFQQLVNTPPANRHCPRCGSPTLDISWTGPSYSQIKKQQRSGGSSG